SDTTALWKRETASVGFLAENARELVLISMTVFAGWCRLTEECQRNGHSMKKVVGTDYIVD
ncbi:MAG: hypothetical protein ACYCY5_13040, partial [Sulfuricella sp.]